MGATLFIFFAIWSIATFLAILGIASNHNPSEADFFGPTPVIIIILLPPHRILTSYFSFGVG